MREPEPWVLRVARRATVFALVSTLAASPGWAQDGSPVGAALTLGVGGETENYLRYLQTVGDAPLSQWSIRAFGPREVNALLSGATADPFRTFEHPVHATYDLRWQLAPVVADAWYETGFPFGGNDGAVWRGRGLTNAVQGGIALRFGVLSVDLRPVAFRAANREFPLMPNGQTSALVYADPLRPRNIDRPQRFGAGAYARIDPGQSTIRVDAGGITLGVSTANQWWGPMSEWPYLLGTNAAGFPHAFAGSSHPWNVGIGRIHGKVIYGRLEQSDYTDIVGSARSRYIGGVIGSFMPRGVDGLEIGVARLFETAWPTGGFGWAQLRKPFEPVLKVNVVGDSGASDHSSSDNQLASVFARWVIPRSGFEFYGEFGREDHSWNTFDLLEEPDHSSTLGLGMRKAWRRDDTGLSAFRAELFDLDPSTLGRHRGQGSLYTHSVTRQGHTELGQVLGAGFAAINGIGTMLAYDRYSANQQKSSLSLRRMVVRERAATATIPGSLDVQYALTAERTRRVGKVGLTYGLTGVYELNRYFQNDATNLELTTRLAW